MTPPTPETQVDWIVLVKGPGGVYAWSCRVCGYLLGSSEKPDHSAHKDDCPIGAWVADRAALAEARRLLAKHGTIQSGLGPRMCAECGWVATQPHRQGCALGAALAASGEEKIKEPFTASGLCLMHGVYSVDEQNPNGDCKVCLLLARFREQGLTDEGDPFL